MKPILLTGTALAASFGFSSPSLQTDEGVQDLDLELASVAVTDGVVGGLIGPMPRPLLAAGYDRIQRRFQAVWRTETSDEEVWVAELDPDQFRSLLEIPVASGLEALPLEDPPNCMDIYGRRRQIRLNYRGVQWANGAPLGCDQKRSVTLPSEMDLLRFDQVVRRLQEALAELEARPGTTYDLDRVVFLRNTESILTYQRVMEHVLCEPIRHEIDLERVWVSERSVSFCWRGRGPGATSGDLRFVVDALGNVSRGPALSSTMRAQGFEPVRTGEPMSDVVERLGQPDRLEVRGNVAIVTYLGGLSGTRGIRPGSLPARIRFQDGRVSEP